MSLSVRSSAKNERREEEEKKTISTQHAIRTANRNVQVLTCSAVE